MKYIILFLLLSHSFIFGQSTFELEMNSDGVVLPRIEKSDKMMLNPKEGQLFYNPEESALMYYNGADWISLKGQVVVTDVDGNTYNTVKIGNLEWMASNLKTTKLNDGTPLTMGGSGSSFQGKGSTKNDSCTPSFYYYNNDSITHASTYGALYDFCAVATGNLCPTGWNVPTEPDWNNLTAALGGFTVAGGTLKETGIVNWNTPNTGATNSSGFTARPGGAYDQFSTFIGLGTSAHFWRLYSNTVTVLPGFTRLNHDNAMLDGQGEDSLLNAKSVRCVR